MAKSRDKFVLDAIAGHNTLVHVARVLRARGESDLVRKVKARIDDMERLVEGYLEPVSDESS